MSSSDPTFRSSYPVIAWIIVICCVIEGVLLIADIGLFGGARLRATAYDYGAFWPGLLWDWQPNYRAQPVLMFVTYGFLHGGLLHLVFNMVTLASLGRAVHERAGQLGFLMIISFSCIVGGASYAVIGSTSTPMVGASGGLFGLAGALVGWRWRSSSTVRSAFLATWKPLLFLFLINVLLYFLFSGRVAWQAHLGGFVAGWLAAIWIERGDPQ